METKIKNCLTCKHYRGNTIKDSLGRIGICTNTAFKICDILTPFDHCPRYEATRPINIVDKPVCGNCNSFVLGLDTCARKAAPNNRVRAFASPCKLYAPLLTDSDGNGNVQPNTPQTSAKGETKGAGSLTVGYPHNLEYDPVNHPSHYTRYGVEVIELTEHLNFCRGNAVKYICRAGLKPGADELEDLKKAKWYLEREISRMEGKKNG